MDKNDNQQTLHNQKILQKVNRLMDELSIMTSKLNQSVDYKLKMRARKARLKHKSNHLVR